MPEHFAGFPNEAFPFLAGLDADNSEAYFEAHRKMYEDSVKTPMRLLFTAVAAELQDSVSF